MYLVMCACPLLYIGKTSRSLRIRLLEHQSRIRLEVTEAPMVEHFLTSGHKEDEFSHTVLNVGKMKGQELEKELLRSKAY